MRAASGVFFIFGGIPCWLERRPLGGRANNPRATVAPQEAELLQLMGRDIEEHTGETGRWGQTKGFTTLPSICYHLFKGNCIFSLVGLKGNLSLLDFFARGLNQMEIAIWLGFSLEPPLGK